MVFSSPLFLFLFLPATIFLYLAVPRGMKNALLFLASIVFYAWGEQLFCLVMLASILVNWVMGLLLERFRERRAAISIMVCAVVLNIGLLGFYKYSGFLVEQFNALAALLHWSGIAFEKPHLPLGISFFTFHALSYVIDVYRRDAQAQRNPLNFALYISFFPQLIAGPIVRYHDICDQLTNRRMRFDLAVSGVERFVAGFGKKMILANPLGEIADRVYALPTDQLGTEAAWIGAVAYTLQIYLDFSAYSDMAIGLARFFGFNFLENFNYPYLSRSIQEFWRRWHISLSNWFLDYLYIPLGGSRVPKWHLYFNLCFVFVVCGFWHGANWTFVIWGALHGTFLVLERVGFSKTLERLPTPFGHLYTMVVVSLAWVFFRSYSLHGAIGYLLAMFGRGAVNNNAIGAGQLIDTQALLVLGLGTLAALGVFSRLTTDWRYRAEQKRGVIKRSISTLRIGEDGTAVLAIRLALLLSIALLASAKLAANTYNPFIYFRF